MDAYEYYLQSLNKDKEARIKKRISVSQKETTNDLTNEIYSTNTEGSTYKTLEDQVTTDDKKFNLDFGDGSKDSDGIIDFSGNKTAGGDALLHRKDTLTNNQVDMIQQAISSGSYLKTKETEIHLKNQLEAASKLVQDKDKLKELNVSEQDLNTFIDTVKTELEDPSLSNMRYLTDTTEQALQTNRDLNSIKNFKDQMDKLNLDDGSKKEYEGFWNETIDAFKAGSLSIGAKLVAVPFELLGDKEDKGFIGQTLTRLHDISTNSDYYGGYNSYDSDRAAAMVLKAWKDPNISGLRSAFLLLKAAYVTPQVLAQSAPEMIVIAGTNLVTGGTLSGLMLSTALTGSAYAGENLRIAQDNNNGKELSAQHKTGIILGSYLNSLIQNGAMEVTFGHGLNKLVFGNKLTKRKIMSFEELKKLHPEQAHAALWNATVDAIRTASKAGIVEMPAEFIDPIATGIMQEYRTDKYKDKTLDDVIDSHLDEAIVGASLGFYAGKAMNLTFEGAPKIYAVTNRGLANRLYRDPNFNQIAQEYLNKHDLADKDRETVLEHLSHAEKEIQNIYKSLNNLKADEKSIENLKEIENPETSGEHLHNMIVQDLKKRITSKRFTNPQLKNAINNNLSLTDVVSELLSSTDPNKKDTVVEDLFDILVTDTYAKKLGFDSALDLVNKYTLDPKTPLDIETKSQIVNDLLMNSKYFSITDVLTDLYALKEILNKTPKENKHLILSKLDTLENLTNIIDNKSKDIIESNPITKSIESKLKKEELIKLRKSHLEAATAQTNIVVQLKQTLKPKAATIAKIYEQNIKEKKEDSDKKINEFVNEVNNKGIDNISSLSKLKQTLNKITDMIKYTKSFNEADIDTKGSSPSKEAVENFNATKRALVERSLYLLKKKGYDSSKLKDIVDNDKTKLDKETFEFISTLSDLLDQDVLTQEDIDSLGSNIEGLDGISVDDLKLLINFIKTFKALMGGDITTNSSNTYQTYKSANIKDLQQRHLTKFKEATQEEKIQLATKDLSFITRLFDNVKQSMIDIKIENIKVYIESLITNPQTKKALLNKLNNIQNVADLRNLATDLLHILGGHTQQKQPQQPTQNNNNKNTTDTQSTPENSSQNKNTILPENAKPYLITEDKQKAKYLIIDKDVIYPVIKYIQSGIENIGVSIPKKALLDPDSNVITDVSLFKFINRVKNLDKKLQENPNNQELQAEVLRYKSFITDIISNSQFNITAKDKLSNSKEVEIFSGKILSSYKKDGEVYINLLTYETDPDNVTGSTALHYAPWKQANKTTYQIVSIDKEGMEIKNTVSGNTYYIPVENNPYTKEIIDNLLKIKESQKTIYYGLVQHLNQHLIFNNSTKFGSSKGLSEKFKKPKKENVTTKENSKTQDQNPPEPENKENDSKKNTNDDNDENTDDDINNIDYIDDEIPVDNIPLNTYFNDIIDDFNIDDVTPPEVNINDAMFKRFSKEPPQNLENQEPEKPQENNEPEVESKEEENTLYEEIFKDSILSSEHLIEYQTERSINFDINEELSNLLNQTKKDIDEITIKLKQAGKDNVQLRKELMKEIRKLYNKKKKLKWKEVMKALRKKPSMDKFKLKLWNSMLEAQGKKPQKSIHSSMKNIKENLDTIIKKNNCK